MKNNIRTKAKAFLNEYKLNEVTLQDLRRIINSQGYTIIEFNHIFNDENVTKLIESLGVEEAIDKSRGFTYADRQRRLVFLHEDLSDDEKRLVLAHEEGHIYCEHLSSHPIIGKDVVEEHEANEFTHYILNVCAGRKFTSIIRNHKKVVSIVAVLLIVFAIGLVVFNAIKKEQSYYGEYYLTSTGNKYHEEQCIFVKEKTNIRRMTIDEFESGEYEPCDICLPHSNVNTEIESRN